MKLKVLSFNICHGLGIDGRQDLPRIADLIRREAPDVAGVQEVDRYWRRSGLVDQAERLGSALHMQYAYGANLRLDPEAEAEGGQTREYGTLVLSRHRIVWSRNHKLPQIVVPGAWNEERGVLEAHVDVGGEQVRVYNTHLGLTQAERLAQVEKLLDICRPEDGRCIVTGDFNAEPDSLEIGRMTVVMRDAFGELGLHRALTFLESAAPTAGAASYAPARRIDYIFCSRDIRVIRGAVLPSIASDHLPIVAEFGW